MAKEDQPAQLPLTELCAICHEKRRKYKCPRCASRTCSLACSRRHKLWSQCSGLRDPAAYLKRSELATPAAFDKDFNFLTGIERSLERAEVDAEARGIDLLADAGLNGGKAKQRCDQVRGEVPLQRGLERSGVRIVKAPKGMTRNKLNTSHWHKKQKCLSWAVEWIFPGGEKTISKCLDTTSVGTALTRLSLIKELGFSSRVYGEKATEPPTKKRKVSIEKINKDETTTPEEGQTAKPSAVEDVDRGEPDDDTVPDDVSSSKTLSPGPALPSTHESEPPLMPPPAPLTSTAPPTSEDNPSCSDTSSSKLHIYLHRPQTCAKVPVLIPITDQSMALGEVLRERTVLEFPTFYVLEHSPDEISGEKYLLEEQYLAQRKEGGEPEGSGEEGEVDEEDSEEAKKLAELNAMKVMEVLRKDLEANVASYF
ncbi:Box C/D snoRNA accumulation [Microsporum audouinii]